MPNSIIERTYEDSIEEYLVVLVSLVEPDYEIWRPYFEIDFQYMSECLTSDEFLARSEGSIKLTNLVIRFLSVDVPLWVREQILERVALSPLEVVDKFSEFTVGVVAGTMQGIVKSPEYRMALEELMDKSEMARNVFSGVDWGSL